MSKVHYNNNIFSFRGKIGRVSYVIQNLVVNIIGFKFIYYPACVEIYRTLLVHPEGNQIISTLYQSPFYAAIFDNLANAPIETSTSIAIKYLFLIPLRMIDIKRIRDIVNNELTLLKTAFFAIVLSLPLMDLIATFVLAIIRPNRFAKAGSDLEAEIKEKDMIEAKNEHDMAMYKRLFEDGKISRSEYLKAIEKNKNIN